MSHATYTAHVVEGTLVVGVVGELDMSVVEDVVAGVRRAIDDSGCATARIDLSQTGFLDSYAIQHLLHLQLDARSAGVTLHWQDPQPWVRRILQVTGVDKHLDNLD